MAMVETRRMYWMDAEWCPARPACVTWQISRTWALVFAALCGALRVALVVALYGMMSR